MVPLERNPSVGDADLLTTVASFREPWEAHMLRGRLEAEGIPATVAHDHHVWVNWSLSTALGGVKVQVPRTMGDNARAIEALCREGVFEADLRAKFGDLDDYRCRACGADQFRKRRPVLQLLISILLTFSTGVVTPPWSWIRQCENCGTNFEP